MQKRIHQRVLLVEGSDDVRLIPYIVEANGVAWGTRSNPVVTIKEFGGFESIVAAGTIDTEAKASGVTCIGILVDANDSAERRFHSLRNACRSTFPDLPTSLPADGLVHENEDGRRIGIWLMPDNQSRGMMETFLTFMIQNHESDSLFEHAKQSCDAARTLGAVFKEVYIDKARIHCWLAWQEKPGRQLHDAVKFAFLDATSKRAQPFIQWFRKLYEL